MFRQKNISDIVSRAKERKERLSNLRDEVEKAKATYEKALRIENLEEAELRLVCAFLQEHNSGVLDQGETWLEEFSLNKVHSSEVAKLLSELENE